MWSLAAGNREGLCFRPSTWACGMWVTDRQRESLPQRGLCGGRPMGHEGRGRLRTVAAARHSHNGIQCQTMKYVGYHIRHAMATRIPLGLLSCIVFPALALLYLRLAGQAVT